MNWKWSNDPQENEQLPEAAWRPKWCTIWKVESLQNLLRVSSMKTIPPSCPEPETGRKYWRSLDQLAETPEFRTWVEREFPAGASEWTDPVSRRHFVKIMSASFLLAGLGVAATGCRRPEEKILPFAKMPENYVHGVAQYYATAMPTRGSAIPLVVKSNDGRPTKVEGNSQHPGQQRRHGSLSRRRRF